MSSGPARPTILLSCGEASGDLYAAAVARALRRRLPGARLVGVAGPRLAPELDEAWLDQRELAVMGFGEVVGHLSRLRRLAFRVADRARLERVDLFLPVDYPGWHLRVARRVRSAGIPVLDLIPPKTWSWGRWRLRGLRPAVDRCAVIFPFEEEHYREAGVDAHFVGHPLADLHADALAGPAPVRSGLLVAPGSREQELERILPVVAGALSAQPQPGPLRVSCAPSVSRERVRELLGPLGATAELVDGPLVGELRRCAAAVVTSGTATLEAALAGAPHVIVYRTSALTYAIASRLATVDHVGMANIVLGERAFPELVQGELRADRLAGELAGLARPGGARAQADACRRLREALGGPGCFDRVAGLAAGMLARP